MPDFSSLLPFGWSDSWSALLPENTLPARVIRHDGATLLIATSDGPLSIRTPARPGLAPTVGDWLAVEEASRSAVAVLPRASLLRRHGAHIGARDQSLAANVDIVLITCGLDRPVKPGRLDRSIALAVDAGATPMIVLTKAASAHPPDLDQLAAQHPGVAIVVTSALEGIGIDALRDALVGSTAVLLGESGAGKSTLTNALLGRDEAYTGDVRGDAKGRHTTTSRQLHVLDGGGVIIDTPGIRAVGLWTDPDAVDEAFSDIGAIAENCRFRDCRHDTEPGCAVRGAIDDGSLSVDRHAAWRRLRREAASAELRASPREQRRRGKTFSRAAKLGQARKRGF
ncbi:MAG: ribosome small subunit-dependent GTPase A [Microbacteriaceae bacterium]|nr:ribosome small subunit-dependent GTPase A [Microbacteriaceae bacterium]